MEIASWTRIIEYMRAGRLDYSPAKDEARDTAAAYQAALVDIEPKEAECWTAAKFVLEAETNFPSPNVFKRFVY